MGVHRVTEEQGIYFVWERAEVVMHFFAKQAAHELLLFLGGFKRMYCAQAECDPYPRYLLLRFPYTQNSNARYIFFQDERTKDAYLHEEVLCSGDTLFELRGRMYGYPPIAIQDFLMRHPYFKSRKPIPHLWRVVYYHGMKFVCRKDHVDDALSWLRHHCPIPADYASGEAQFPFNGRAQTETVESDFPLEGSNRTANAG